MSFKALLPGLSIIVASLIWATDATVRDRAFGGGAARTVAFLEHLMAFIVVAPLIFQSKYDRVMPASRAEWLQVIVLGVGGSALAGTVYTLGVEGTGAALAAVFTFIQPLFVLVFAYLFLRERSSTTFYFAALWVVANAILLSFPYYDLESMDDSSKLWGGAGLVAIAAIIWSGSAIAGKSLLRTFEPLVVLVWRFGSAALVLFLSLFLFPEPVALTTLLSDQGLLSVLYLGIVVNAIGFLFYYHGLKRLPVRLVAFIELLYPLFGLFVPIWSSGGNASMLQVFGSVTLLLAVGILLILEYPRKIGSLEE